MPKCVKTYKPVIEKHIKTLKALKGVGVEVNDKSLWITNKLFSFPDVKFTWIDDTHFSVNFEIQIIGEDKEYYDTYKFMSIYTPLESIEFVSYYQIMFRLRARRPDPRYED